MSSPTAEGDQTATTPLTTRQRIAWHRQTISGYLILAVTTVAGFAAFGLALRAVAERSRDNERNVCTAAWDRYDGRVGIRSELFAIRDRFIRDPAGAAYLDFTELTNTNVPALKHPDCARPAGMQPERPMP